MATKKELIDQTAKNTYNRAKNSTLRTIKSDLKRIEQNEPKDKKSYMYLLYLGAQKGLNKRLKELQTKK